MRLKKQLRSETYDITQHKMAALRLNKRFSWRRNKETNNKIGRGAAHEYYAGLSYNWYMGNPCIRESKKPSYFYSFDDVSYSVTSIMSALVFIS
jgi:hypothetical protein